MSRNATNKILEMVENGLLDKDYLISACLQYMSEDDVADMARSNDIEIENQYDPDLLDDDTMEEDEEEEECPNALWYDTSNELL